MLKQPRPLVPFTFGRSSLNGNLFSGLVGYWKMDEASWNGTVGEVVDSSGSGNHGFEVNGATTTSSPAKFGRAGNFVHASNQYVDCGHDSSLFPTAQVSLCAWVYPTAVNVDQAIAGPWESGAGNNNAYLLYVGQNVANDKLRFVVQQADNTKIGLAPASGATLIANTWQHVAAIADGSVLRIYLNSIDCGSTVAYNGTLKGYTSTNFWIGRLSGAATFGWSGGIDEVRVYNRALSATEVAQLYGLII